MGKWSFFLFLIFLKKIKFIFRSQCKTISSCRSAVFIQMTAVAPADYHALGDPPALSRRVSVALFQKYEQEDEQSGTCLSRSWHLFRHVPGYPISPLLLLASPFHRASPFLLPPLSSSSSFLCNVDCSLTGNGPSCTRRPCRLFSMERASLACC